MIGGRSRNRVVTMPSSSATQAPLTTRSTNAGNAMQAGPAQRLREHHQHDHVDDQVVREEQLCRHDQPVDVHRERRRQVLDQALVAMKTSAPSLMQPLMKDQTMKPTRMYGSCTARSLPNSPA